MPVTPAATAAEHHARPLADQLTDEVPGLLRYARTLVRDAAAAEDLVQDTVVRALERADGFRGDSSLRTWLHRILHNLAVDAARARRETVVDPGTAYADGVELLWQDPAYSVDAAEVVERAEQRELLEDALLRLPALYRSTVVLHDGCGLTVGEIADLDAIGVPAAKARLRRGRMMLVSELSGARRRPASPDVPLRCWDARSLVSDYLDDDLAPRERGLLERHLAACPTCPPLYAGLVGVRDALGARRDDDAAVPVPLRERLAAITSAARPSDVAGEA